MTAMLDFDDVLITCGFDTKYVSLKICIDWIIVLTLLEIIGELVPSLMYEVPIILR